MQVACKPISLTGDKVVYRGEGVYNLVIALTDRRIVLRFPKSKFADKSQDEKLECIARYLIFFYKNKYKTLAFIF